MPFPFEQLAHRRQRRALVVDHQDRMAATSYRVESSSHRSHSWVASIAGYHETSCSSRPHREIAGRCDFSGVEPRTSYLRCSRMQRETRVPPTSAPDRHHRHGCRAGFATKLPRAGFETTAKQCAHLSPSGTRRACTQSCTNYRGKAKKSPVLPISGKRRMQHHRLVLSQRTADLTESSEDDLSPDSQKRRATVHCVAALK